MWGTDSATSIVSLVHALVIKYHRLYDVHPKYHSHVCNSKEVPSESHPVHVFKHCISHLYFPLATGCFAGCVSGQISETVTWPSGTVQEQAWPLMSPKEALCFPAVSHYSLGAIVSHSRRGTLPASTHRITGCSGGLHLSQLHLPRCLLACRCTPQLLHSRRHAWQLARSGLVPSKLEGRTLGPLGS